MRVPARAAATYAAMGPIIVAALQEPAELSNLVQQLAQHLHIGVAAMAQGFLCDEDASAPSMCNPACDCHPWPRLQSLNQLRLPVEVVLRPHRFLLVHGVYDDGQDTRIEFPRCEAKVPI